MSDHDIVDHGGPVTGDTPSEWIGNRIAVRYAHPSRQAHLYLFQLTDDADLDAIPPDPAQIKRAWVDAGGGLATTLPALAVAQCQALYDQLRAVSPPPRGRFITQQLMARLVVFSVTALANAAEPTMRVELFSRALAFTPKADRRVIELWRQTDSGWYSTYTGRDA